MIRKTSPRNRRAATARWRREEERQLRSLAAHYLTNRAQSGRLLDVPSLSSNHDQGGNVMAESLAPSELRDLFFNDVSETVILDTARCIIGSYSEAYRYCIDNFPGPEAHDLYPIARRAMFERNWRARLSRYDVGVTAEPNAIANCFHTELRSGRVVVTVSAVAAPGEVVREAVFRNGLAQDSQLDLFLAPVPPPDDAKLYAIILHGPLGGGLLLSPSFINVAFPGSDCDFYVDRFNLLDYYPVLQAELDKLPKADVQERKKPRLRRDQHRKAE